MSARACPVCGAGAAPLLSIPRLPVFANQLCRTRETALSAPTATFELRLCTVCSHAYNSVFDASLMEYGPEYESSLHFSSTFQDYAHELSERLVERYQLAGKQIVEIGCGRGDFLRLLCARGRNRGVGFDPSYSAAPGPGVPGVTFVREACTAASLEGVRADLVLCRHVLEHVADPVLFLRGIRRACARPEGTSVFFEVPNGVVTLAHGGVWDLIYEHASYFTPGSLRRAFIEAGFTVQAVEPAFGGQFLTIHARAYPHAWGARPRSEASAPFEVSGTFARRYAAALEAWASELGEHRGRVAIWGAGSKGTTFLNVVTSSDSVSAVVDVNPRKQGAFVPGTGHVIVAPSELRARPPELVVVMNPIYEREIAGALATLGLAPAMRSATSPPAARAA